MAHYRIKEATRFEDIAQWRAKKDQTLKFEVSKQASFGLAAEGIAIGLLSELQAESIIDVDCNFELTSADPKTQLRVFDGLFGFALVSAAKSIKTPTQENGRTEILKFLRQRLRDGQGTLGDGKRQALISRDPEEPIPSCLNEGFDFPKRDRFGSVLYKKAVSLGAGDKQRSYSNSEEEAITFIYEAARNSWEHGRNSLNGDAISGIRGVLIERLSFTSHQELVKRRDLSELQRDYFERQWKDFGAAKLATAYTVADLGPGIHMTLQPNRPEESEWERLERAFRPGESRKPKGNDVESGMGLWKLYSAASRLKALLCIKSGNLLAYVDFSEAKKETIPRLLPWKEAEGLNRSGTSLTLIWPRVDQQMLFY